MGGGVFTPLERVMPFQKFTEIPIQISSMQQLVQIILSIGSNRDELLCLLKKGKKGLISKTVGQ